jgi:hypothetical protein
MRFDYQTLRGGGTDRKGLTEKLKWTNCTGSEHRPGSAHMAVRSPCPSAWPPLPSGGDKVYFKWPEAHSNAQSAAGAITLAVFQMIIVLFWNSIGH